MKRYIKAADEFTDSPFRRTTGTSYGDDFLNPEDLKYMQEAKNRTGHIVMMSPNDYFEACSVYGFNHYVPVEKLKEQRSQDYRLNNKYKKMMQSGVKFDMCYINYADHTQEGLHRMLVAGELYGWDTKFPVLIIEVYDKQREEEWKKIRAFNDFTIYKFDDICKDAAYELANTPTPPDNFTELLRDRIIELAKDYHDQSYDIDVEIESDVLDGDHRLSIFVTRFEDYIPEVWSNPCELWLENLFNYRTELTDEEINESLLDSLDDDDIDISDFFFKDT